MTGTLQYIGYAVLILTAVFTMAVSNQALAESGADSQSQVTFYVH